MTEKPDSVLRKIKNRKNVKRTRRAGHYWRRKDELLSDMLL